MENSLKKAKSKSGMMDWVFFVIVAMIPLNCEKISFYRVWELVRLQNGIFSLLSQVLSMQRGEFDLSWV